MPALSTERGFSMRSAALNLAALSFGITAASACAAPIDGTDPVYSTGPNYSTGPIYTTDPTYFTASRYVADQTYFIAPTYTAIGGFYVVRHRHRHHHACGQAIRRRFG
jgi:hypothetical protein